jgi:hypothetical protein
MSTCETAPGALVRARAKPRRDAADQNNGGLLARRVGAFFTISLPGGIDCFGIAFP